MPDRRCSDPEDLMAHKVRYGGIVGLLLVLRTVVTAQTGGATAALSGIVGDSSGGVLPGVTVVVRNTATGVAVPPVVTNGAGLFSVPALDAASYTVTCTLGGFKTVVVTDVLILTATPADLKITLEVGDIAEVVQVAARSEVVHRQSTTVSSTLSSDQIRNLPLTTKDALNFVTFLPGFDTGGVHTIRTATSAAGLPQSALVISIDGIQTQHPITKSSDGFWSYISPQIDAMEEVTVATATPGADASAHGAVQIRFTTRSGSDHYSGALFETWRDPILNANTFFNKVNGLPVNQITMHQYGGNAGGPIVLPGLNLRRKAFFFTDLERLHLPSEITRRPLFMSPAARTGLFTYTTNNIARQVNVLDVAGANGQIASINPTIAGLLGEIAATTTITGSTTPNGNGNTIGYSWNSRDSQSRWFSTNRIDVAAAAIHRFTGIYTFNKFNRNPNALAGLDPRFPGLPNHGANVSPRNSVTGTMRSMFTPTLVGESTFGVFWTSNTPGAEITSAQFDNQGGHSLMLAGGGSAFAGLTPATAGLAATDANGAGNRTRTDPGSVWSAAERVNWQHGRHGVQLGGELTMVKGRATSRQIVSALSFDVDTANDPAAAMFSQANFPGASNTDLADARFLYALLTGRVKEITTELGFDPRSGHYAADNPADRRAHMTEVGLFAQDAFRVTPNLTLNLGLRYELQSPFRGDDSVWSYNTIEDACGVSGTGNGPGGRPCNIFRPGTLTGINPVYHRYTAGTTGYDIDWNNLAPSAGLAWLPGIESGVLRWILGDPEQATIRVAYARALVREGLETFAGPYEANPGASFKQVRNADNGTLVLPGETWPLLLAEATRLGALPYAPLYPVPIDRTAGVNLFDPHWKVGSADSFSAGIQRSLSHNMAVELRYVGTYGRDLTYAGNLVEVENWNEINVVENGFLDEFKAAQSNLYANIAAGRGQTIAYAGPATGTLPLPTYLAYFTGSADARNPAAYTGTNWTNGAIVGRFAALNPNPVASALDLHNNATFRSRALAAGIAPNFFVLNPDAGNVNVVVSKVSTRYHALQLDLRRQLSRGLAMTAGYTYAKSWVSRLDSMRSSRYLIPQVNGVPHSLKLTANYEIPFGRGRRYGPNDPSWLAHVASNWSVNLTGKVTSGRLVNFGNVRLVGMTLVDVQDAFKYRIVRNVPNGDGTVTTRVFNLPQDIIDNTVKAFSVNVNGYTGGAPTGRYFAPANGPDCIQVVRGDCAPKDLFVVAPPFTRFDFSAQKRIPTGGKTSVLFEADVFNLFNAINFNPVGLPNAPTNPDNYRVTTSYQDINNTFDPGSRVGQLVIRFKW